jgi:heat shock protein HtpX
VDANERRLYFLVKTLSERAGLPAVPELGIYSSSEMNAFATGHSRASSMIAFSSALVKNMDDDALAAITAHEVAHIANGDMLTMTLMMSVVNTVIMLVNMAMIWILDDHDDGILGRIVKRLIRFAVVVVMMFLGNLLMLWFSRHREFKADQLAAELVWPEAMIKALNSLKAEEQFDELESQEAYASFKISSPPTMCDLFSTHPSLERRIERLKAM